MKALVWLSAVWSVCLVGACGSSSTRADGGTDGGTGGTGGASSGGTGGARDSGARDLQGDLADCQCGVESDSGTSVLTMSWSCFCAAFGCRPANSCADVGGFNVQRTSYSDCALTTYTVDLAGGPETQVYDSSGAEVGALLTSDTTQYACPADPSVRNLRVRAGRFPDSTCQGSTCACNGDAGPACSSAPAGTP
jgi:hypothetical protein